MRKFIIILFSLFTLMGISSQAMAAEEAGLWEKTKQGANTVVEWTVQTSKKGWQATKEVASDVADWTTEKSKKGWKATKEGASDAADWSAGKSDEGWKNYQKWRKLACRLILLRRID